MTLRGIPAVHLHGPRPPRVAKYTSLVFPANLNRRICRSLPLRRPDSFEYKAQLFSMNDLKRFYRLIKCRHRSKPRYLCGDLLLFDIRLCYLCGDMKRCYCLHRIWAALGNIPLFQGCKTIFARRSLLLGRRIM